RAKSNTKKAQIDSQFVAEWRARAAEDYREQLALHAAGQKFDGAEMVRQRWMKKCREETGKDILINKQTLINHAKGKPTRAQSNAQKSWLTAEETELVILYIIELGHRGFPLSHRRLKEHVEEI
ncbi:hypothetical protein BDZ89DRAFT_904951, partial [Hymenopellis radicata]